MKKILQLLVIISIVFTLTGCDLLDENSEGLGLIGEKKDQTVGEVNENALLGEYKNIVISNGIGRTVDAINDSYVETMSGAKPVFDFDKLGEATIIKTVMQTQDADYYYSDTASDFATKSYTKVNNKIDASGKYKIFTASVSRDFSYSASTEYTVNTKELYYTLEQNVVGNRVEIEGYRDVSMFEQYLSEGFLSDLEKLKTDSSFTADNFLNLYGTHVVVAGYFGGKISCSFYLMSNNSTYNSNTQSELEKKLSGGIGKVVGGSYETKLTEELSSYLALSSTEYSFSARGVGGSIQSLGNLDSFGGEYEKWAQSFNDNGDYSVLVDIPEQGLVEIWDLFPAEYASEKEDVRLAFVKQAENVYSEFLDAHNRLFSGGLGTSASPFEISTPKELQNLNGYDSEGVYFKLMNDIDTTRIYDSWIPIGTSNIISVETITNTFRGTLDGSGHTVTYNINIPNVSISSSHYMLGLFGSTDGATIKNLNVDSTITTGGSEFSEIQVGIISPEGVRVGLIVAYAEDTTISNCSTQGTIKLWFRNNTVFTTSGVRLDVGGVVGTAKDSTISNCSNSASIDAKTYYAYMGGIIGKMSSSTETGNENTGSITGLMMPQLHYQVYIGQIYSKNN